jgi:hypothetical protein
MSCDTYLFLSFDTEKDRTLPKVIFMLFIMRPSCVISLNLSFWVYHIALYLESVLPGEALANVRNLTLYFWIFIVR